MVFNADNTNEVLTTDILSWADRPLVNALVRRYAGYACDGNFASAWIEFKKELLYKYSININSRITAYINKNGKKPHTLDVITDDEVFVRVSILVCCAIILSNSPLTNVCCSGGKLPKYVLTIISEFAIYPPVLRIEGRISDVTQCLNSFAFGSLLERIKL